eukprot:4176677-Alexandrium_andersonii.AAC.1
MLRKTQTTSEMRLPWGAATHVPSGIFAGLEVSVKPGKEMDGGLVATGAPEYATAIGGGVVPAAVASGVGVETTSALG